MIPREIAVTWIKPDRWNTLTRFRIDEPLLEINGYKIRHKYITNGANIPWGMRNSFNPVGKPFPACIAHDQRCDDGEPRKESDKLFYRDLKDCGVNKFRARAMYLGVRGYANATGKWS